MGQRDSVVGSRFGERQLAWHFLGEADLAQKAMKLARPPKGELALGVSSSTSLVSPQSEVNSGRVVLCGVGSGVLSIYSYTHSPFPKATLSQLRRSGRTVSAVGSSVSHRQRRRPGEAGRGSAVTDSSDGGHMPPESRGQG